mgnify:CR=1 FL=1
MPAQTKRIVPTEIANKLMYNFQSFFSALLTIPVIQLARPKAKPASSIGTVGKGFEAFVILDENINKEQLLTRFQKAIDQETEWARRSENKLNGNFAQHAPAELVEKEKEILAEAKRKIEKLQSYVSELK